MTQLEKADTSAESDLQLSIPPAYDEVPTINVIVTGESQQGKSTLIRQLARYAGTSGLSIGIGDGNKTCTMEVGNYDLSVTLRGYQLVDLNNERIEKQNYSDLATLDDSEAKVVEVKDAYAPTFRFRFIDTPGLNDTYGEDLSIMSRILSRALDLGHINALIYVRSVDSPFGTSFKNFFRYIQRSMPNLCNGLIVAHSYFTVDRVEEFLNENHRLDEIRQKAFEAATQLELQHFFMDNSPDPTSPFAVMQSLNEIYRLLSHISSQKPLPVKTMKLLKTDAMRHLDVHVVNTLKDLTHRLDKEWISGKSTAEILKSNVITAQREISKLKIKIETKQAQILALNTDDEILLGKKSCVEHYSFIGDLLFQLKLNLGRRKLTYDSDYVISSVTKSCSGGSEWLSEELRGTSWRAEISGNNFRDINGTATFYTTSKLKNKKEIEALEAAVLDLKDTLVTQEELLLRNSGAESPDSRLAQLGNNIAKIEEITESINRDSFDLTLWPSLRGFYTKHTFPTPDDIKDFVGVYDSNISKLL